MNEIEFNKKSLEVINYVQSLFPEPVYLVGGGVRSMLLGELPKDYDFCSSMSTEQIKECIKGKHRAYLIGEKFGTIGFKALEEDIEITQFRSESYEPRNRKPNVEFVNNLHQDLSRRDFTIGSMCMRIYKSHIRIIDPFQGQDDLENGIIRCVGHPKTRFKEDPLRILRAIRFACRFDFDIEESTFKKMCKMSIHILDISKERWMQELDKILQSENVGKGLRLLWETGLFKYMIPELNLQKGYDQNSQYHDFNLDIHTIQVVEAVRKDTDDLNLLWAALLHDIAKPFVRTDKLVNVGVAVTCPKIVEQKQEGEFVKAVVNAKLESVSGNIKSNYVGHEILGAEMVDRIALHLKWSKERREKVVEIVRNHLNDNSPLREYDNMSKKGKDL